VSTGNGFALRNLKHALVKDINSRGTLPFCAFGRMVRDSDLVGCVFLVSFVGVE
jgi:hypothetical protein